MSTKCTKTNKTRFPDEDHANKRMNAIQRHPNKQVPTRVYQCEFCRGWHLTKRPANEVEGSVKLKAQFAQHILSRSQKTTPYEVSRNQGKDNTTGLHGVSQE